MISDAFPDFDLSTLPPIPSDWIDVSWRHDLCPSWRANECTIYVDHADLKQREYENTFRFAVLDDDGECIISTDEWSDVLKAIK